MIFEHLHWASWWMAFCWGFVAGWLADKAWQLLRDEFRR